MGCGSTKAAPVDESAHHNGGRSSLVNNNNNTGHHDSPNKQQKKKKEQKEKKLNPELPPPKPIAFEVNFNDDNPFKRPPPPRLSRLAPLQGAPTLSHQQLMEKQEQAELARSRELERKRQLSRRSSKKRMSILQAREFDKENQQADFEFQQRMKEEKREQMLEAKREKARRQEERRKRVRAKARRMSEAPEEEVAALDLERDMTFNSGEAEDKDEVDSWLHDENNKTSFSNKLRENPRDDSGNYSNASNHGNQSDRGFSAQTIESLHVNNTRGERVKLLPDDEDFFDS